MAATPPFRFPMASPGPLNPLSPERVNATANKALPDFSRSPPMPIFDGMGSPLSLQNSPTILSRGQNSPTKGGHIRTHSDVQGMVARFNSLDIKDHAEMSKNHKAALRRAQMGREEAEHDLSKAREELRKLKKDNDEGRDREMKVMKRLDVVMEELHRAKETQAHAQNLYEKEIRKARKEAFRASSALVKLQEEVKSARNSQRAAQIDLDTEKAKVRQRDEDVFNAEYKLVGVQQELDKAQTTIQVVIEERDALKTSLKEEEVARIAAEGRIALPPSKDEEDEFASPKKKTPQPPRFLTDRSVERPRTPSEAEHLKAELRREQHRRVQAEGQVDFMKMECQFQCCSCRVAENSGMPFTYDTSHDQEILGFKQHIAMVKSHPEIEVLPMLKSEIEDPEIKIEDEEMHDAVVPTTFARAVTPPNVDQPMHDATSEREERKEVKFSPGSGTFRKGTPAKPRVAPPVEEDEEDEEDTPTFNVVLPRRSPTSENTYDAADSTCLNQAEVRSVKLKSEPELNDQFEVKPQSLDLIPEQDIPPTPAVSRPAPQHTYRTMTTTTTVPLADEAESGPRVFDFGMGDLTKEEAIEKLRERRGRARSITGTPKKPVVTETKTTSKTPRRDISAPELRKTPKSMPKLRT